MKDATGCRHCGSPLPPRKPGPGRRRLYCSSRCSDSARRQPAPLRPPAPCRQCGALVPQPQRGRAREFCSTACRSRWHTLRTPSRAQAGAKACAFCGWTFLATNAGHRFCSQQCAQAEKGLQGGRRFSCDRFTVILWSDCADCARTWPSTFAQASRCPSCSVSRRRAVKRMRNAFRRGAPSISGQVITDSEIFERDGWRCQLCGDPVLPFIKGLHPRQASIDHIAPVSRGGEHVAANLQLAHFGCNSAKRDRTVVPCHSEGASTSSLPAAPSGCAPGPSATSAAPGGSGAETPTVLSPAA